MAVFDSVQYDLIEHAQLVGHGDEYFVFRNLYCEHNLIKEIKSRKSIRLTTAIHEDELQHLKGIKDPTTRKEAYSKLIRQFSIPQTGRYCDGIELSGWELFLLTQEHPNR